MNTRWLSYVPHHVVRGILAQPDASIVGQEERFTAVGMFMDISGFSAMSEALGKSGKVGSEELTDILNGTFTPLIDLIESYGGIIGKFGGDALTILMPYTEQTQSAVARRAMQCAVETQAFMQANETIHTRVGNFKLAIKIGVAQGPVLCLSVGDPAVRLEYVIAGSVIDRCAEAEHHAEKGEIIVEQALLPFAPDAELGEMREEFAVLHRLTDAVDQAPLVHPADVPDAAAALLAAYLHPTIAQRVQSGQSGFINEHRRVTVLFVSFSGFDYDHDDDVGRALQDYLGAIIRIVQRYDGYVNKVDMGDKGSKAIILFGAPVAHENDPERALRCALEIARLPMPARIGVNTGFVYCGQVGSPLRQEYTVMGDAVNVSARLMQATQPGQILVSESTKRPAQGFFSWQEMEPLTVKGKVEPVPVALLHGTVEAPALELQEPSYALPMVGREREMALAREKIAAARAGNGQILGILGEAGMGKSRLNAEIIKVAAGEGLVGYGGECQSYGTMTSYLVWHKVWRGFFGLDVRRTPAEQAEQLVERLRAIDPDLAARAPLVGPAVGLEIPDNAVTESLEGQTRQDSLHALLLDALIWRGRQSPLLLVLEDGQWMDALSLDLLRYIGRNIADLPALLVLVYRPAMAQLPEIMELREHEHFSEIELTEFGAEAVRELVRLKVLQLFGSGEMVPVEFIERVVARAESNPFYVEEIINFLHDRHIDLHNTVALREFELPASLHNLIISRIDQLAEDEKTTLKIASVIGRWFRAGWVWGAYPDLGAPEHVMFHLQNLSHTELTAVHKPEPELEYLFKHIITQEVAYDTLAFATRQTLHDRFAGYIEERYTEELPGYLDVLAYHYGRGRLTDKQREFFRRAGDAAKQDFANEAALTYFERLLPLLDEAERPAVLLAQGEIWQITGQWAEAERAYSAALAGAGERASLRAQALSVLGELNMYRANPDAALTVLEDARAIYEGLGEPAGLAKTLQRLALLHLRQGGYDRALEYATRQVPLANQIGDARGLAESYMVSGWIHRNSGRLNEAVGFLQKAVQITQDNNERFTAISAQSDLAGVYMALGDIPSALRHCDDALDIAEQIGYLSAVGHLVGNIGELLRHSGQLDDARRCYALGLQTALEIGDDEGVLVNLLNLAGVFIQQGDRQRARRLSDRAVTLARGIQVAYLLGEALCTQAELSIDAGELEAGAGAADEALRLAQDIDLSEVRFKAALLGARARSADAVTALLNEWPDVPQQAAIYYALWQDDRAREDSRTAAADLYREAYTQMGAAEFRARYHDLTGEWLPELEARLALPNVVAEAEIDLEHLLARAE
ncbi:MAG: tetratricopeptide repeat protein [Anaerolineae bacterium]|nr:tetratricopeptide repeat protein [Anaerolineae bacterium]